MNDTQTTEISSTSDGNISSPFSTMADVRAANRALGHHFFERDTMRFFESRVESALYAGRYFITSEKAGFRETQRKFTIREVTPDGYIKTVGEFCAYDFIENARDEARRLAAGSYPWQQTQ